MSVFKKNFSYAMRHALCALRPDSYRDASVNMGVFKKPTPTNLHHVISTAGRKLLRADSRCLSCAEVFSLVPRSK